MGPFQTVYNVPETARLAHIVLWLWLAISNAAEHVLYLPHPFTTGRKQVYEWIFPENCRVIGMPTMNKFQTLTNLLHKYYRLETFGTDLSWHDKIKHLTLLLRFIVSVCKKPMTSNLQTRHYFRRDT